jgi:hypothetical protein
LIHLTLKEIDNFYYQKEEPTKGCLIALREIILKQDEDISATWKYGMPFFCYKGKMFCYLWVKPKGGEPYIGLIEGKRFDHPDLLIEKRSRMKIMLFNPNKDLPVETINAILKQAINLYKTGLIKLK